MLQAIASSPPFDPPLPLSAVDRDAAVWNLRSVAGIGSVRAEFLAHPERKLDLPVESIHPELQPVVDDIAWHFSFRPIAGRQSATLLRSLAGIQGAFENAVHMARIAAFADFERSARLDGAESESTRANRRLSPLVTSDPLRSLSLSMSRSGEIVVSILYPRGCEPYLKSFEDRLRIYCATLGKFLASEGIDPRLHPQVSLSKGIVSRLFGPEISVRWRIRSDGPMPEEDFHVRCYNVLGEPPHLKAYAMKRNTTGQSSDDHRPYLLVVPMDLLRTDRGNSDLRIALGDADALAGVLPHVGAISLVATKLGFAHVCTDTLPLPSGQRARSDAADDRGLFDALFANGSGRIRVELPAMAPGQVVRVGAELENILARVAGFKSFVPGEWYVDPSESFLRCLDHLVAGVEQRAAVRGGEKIYLVCGRRAAGEFEGAEVVAFNGQGKVMAQGSWRIDTGSHDVRFLP